MVSTEQLKLEILNYLIENGEHKDIVDIASEFSHRYGITVDVPCLAVAALEEEGKVQRINHSFVRAGYRVL